jgi:hypothetical protein
LSEQIGRGIAQTDRVKRCEAAGCISTDTDALDYRGLDGHRAHGWFCAEHSALLRERSAAIALARVMEAQSAAMAAYEVLAAHPERYTSGAGDDQLRALEHFMTVARDVEDELANLADPEAKAWAAGLSERLDASERLLAAALAARRRDQGHGGDER